MNEDVIFHIVPYEFNGKTYYATIKHLIEINKTELDFHELIDEYKLKQESNLMGNESLSQLKRRIFPSYLKFKSIKKSKGFKKMSKELSAWITLNDSLKESEVIVKMKELFEKYELSNYYVV